MAILLENKKAYFDYEILEKLEAGLELLGGEVKSLRNKHGSLIGARVLIRGGEAFLLGMAITPYQTKNMPGETAEQRTIKLLLTKKEISYLAGKAEERGLTIIPLNIHTLGKKIKTEIGLARGKKKFEKREKIKKRDTDREMRREMKM
ncbi:MAG: SsrA-binding protein [Candidatus Amesbacteria bacterium GW2011_GWA2_42_12]|uniref:SsrA-binding protein n=1 Tax=Candidatus Amesbacteria bacterium GW2011_GWA2_42_12 TaxID=1618356 RepID=A0A0G0Y251_9BACT|nr:MAG: SsrA-binding protein [Candidatus Amesbacteria bacterium GW2011_GWA2_42_12]